MSTTFATVAARRNAPTPLAGADLLPRRPIFRADKLEGSATISPAYSRRTVSTFERARASSIFVIAVARLRALRLELARKDLAQDGATVTSVAVACGFGSLGRFAADYKARFGESPSETLRRGRVGR
jgi:AraC-like DNA-binding protein